MANLLSQNIGTNYKSILNLDATTINTPLDATLRAVTDGMGTSSLLQLSTEAVGLSRTVNLSAGATTPRLFNVAYTINNSGAQTGTLTGLFLNATETALNGITHNLMDLQVGGVSRFLVKNNGNVGIGAASTPSARLHIVGSGATSATTSLLVQNSAGNRILQSFDDRTTHAYDLRISTENTYGNWGFKMTSGGAGGGGILSDPTAFGLPAGAIAIGARIVVSNTTNYLIPFTVNSSIFEIYSTTQGFLPPRMTTTQKNAIATPGTGLVVFDTTLAKLAVYTGAAWETVTSV